MYNTQHAKKSLVPGIREVERAAHACLARSIDLFCAPLLYINYIYIGGVDSAEMQYVHIQESRQPPG